MTEAKAGMFDADTFMQETVDAPMETERRLVPEGDYQAMIGDFDSSAMQRFDFIYKKGDRTGQPGFMTKFSVPFVIKDPKATSIVGIDPCTVYWNVNIDVDDNGKIAVGPNMNIDLGKIREAVGQNTPPWAPSRLRNAGPCMVKVAHQTFDRKDGTKGTKATIVMVVKIT